MNFRNLFGRRSVLLATLVLTLAALTLGPVAEAKAQGEPFIELMRKDIQTEKVMLMTLALAPTDAEGEIFWPLYREYQTELSKLGDQRIKLIKEFGANYETMSEDVAKDLAKTWFNMREDQLDLLKKTHKKVSKEISPILAARFTQIESQLILLIELQIAEEMPLIK